MSTLKVADVEFRALTVRLLVAVRARQGPGARPHGRRAAVNSSADERASEREPV